MRILIATGIFEPETGGPATYAPLLAAKLVEAGHRAKVLTYVSKTNGEPASYPFKVVRVVRTGNKIKDRIDYFRAAYRELRGYDLVYTLDWFAAGLPVALAARLRRVPYVVRVGGDYLWEQRYIESNEPPLTLKEFYERGLHRRLEYRLAYVLIRSVLRGAAHVIFNSDKQRELYERHYGLKKERVSTIYNPVLRAGRTGRGSPSKEFVFWGRFIAMKNLAKLIRAFGDADLSDDFTLTLIGDGPRLFELEDLTYELGLEKCVSFVPTMSRTDVLERVQNSRATILPSWTDISPNQVYEAIAIGLPALVTKENYLSIADRLPATVDPHSLEDIAEKIKMLADDAKYEMFAKKFSAISFAHSWEDVLREHVAVFKRIIQSA